MRYAAGGMVFPMTHAESLYAHSRFAVVGGGVDRVRLCVAEVARSASSGERAAPGPARRVLLIHGNPSHMGHWTTVALSP